MELPHSVFECVDDNWSAGVVQKDPYFKMHVMAQVLHYGQTIFEGLKALQRKDGSVVVMNLDMHAARFRQSASGLVMPEVSDELFREAVEMTVKANWKNIPPYGSGASLYLRPLMIGDGVMLGLNPSTRYTFRVLGTPVGGYFESGKLIAQKAIVILDNDRAAPRGLGKFKCSANYIADLKSLVNIKKQKFSMGLYLDSLKQEYIEEFNTSNFVGITHDGVFVTPETDSVLPSVTNKRLQQLAKDMGMRVEVRPINFKKEIETFAEVAGVLFMVVCK
jgi:branched-chain amino acid aminotransferase